MQRLIPLVVTLAVLGAACGSGDTDDAAPAIIIEGASVAPVADGDTAAGGDESAAATTDEASESSSADDMTEAGDDAIADEEAQALAFAECMRDEGLPFPDPTVAADGSVQLIDPNNPPDIDADDPETEAALEVCSDLIEGASFLPSDDETAEIEDQLLQFADCLRDQGIDVSDPNLSGGLNPAAIQEMFGDFDPRAPENAAVVATCQAAFTGGIGGGN